MTKKTHLNKKKHHYVPRFYLKNFSQEKSIWVLNKETGHRFSRNIQEVGHENYFYSIPDIEGSLTEEQKLGVESYFEHLEIRYSSALRKLVRNFHTSKLMSINGEPNIKLTLEDMIDLSHFIVTQEMRTRNFREELAQFNYLMEKSVLDIVTAYKLPELQGEVDIKPNPESEQIRHLEFLLNEEHILGVTRLLLYTKTWYICHNTTNTPFITSDTPVTKRGHSDKYSSGRGWASPLVQIFIPITPEIGLWLVCNQTLNIKTDKDRSPELQFKGVVPVNETDVINFNYLQYISSYRSLFSYSNEFHELDEMIKSLPKYRDPHRQRVKASQSEGLPDNWKQRHKKIQHLK